jgi:exosome complex exonuclease DIS3/RRP44
MLPPQLDFLEHPAITDVVVCSVVMEEVGHKNSAALARLRALCMSDAKRFYIFANEHHRQADVLRWLQCAHVTVEKKHASILGSSEPRRDTYIKAAAGESVNDRNDRAIRVATKW